MENQVYVAMRYDIRGIYGNVTHCTNLIPIEDFDSNKCIESNMTEESEGLICKAQFNVVARRSDNGEDIFEKCDIRGLPKCLGIDMDMYYKMSQTERLDSLKSYTYEGGVPIKGGSDNSTKMVITNKKAKEIMEKIKVDKENRIEK